MPYLLNLLLYCIIIIITICFGNRTSLSFCQSLFQTFIIGRHLRMSFPNGWKNFSYYKWLRLLALNGQIQRIFFCQPIIRGVRRMQSKFNINFEVKLKIFDWLCSKHYLSMLSEEDPLLDSNQQGQPPNARPLARELKRRIWIFPIFGKKIILSKKLNQKKNRIPLSLLLRPFISLLKSYALRMSRNSLKTIGNI